MYVIKWTCPRPNGSVRPRNFSLTQQTVEPNLKGSQVSVGGVFEPAKLVEYVYKRTGKHAVRVKQEEKKEEEEEEKKKKKKQQQQETATGEEEVDMDIVGGMELKKTESLYYPPYYLPRFVPMELHGYRQQYQYPYPNQ